MSDDPLDAVFLNPDEAHKAHAKRTEQRLAKYLSDMPPELRVLFSEKFQRIGRTELAQLRAMVEEQAHQLESARKPASPQE